MHVAHWPLLIFQGKERKKRRKAGHQRAREEGLSETPPTEPEPLVLAADHWNCSVAVIQEDEEEKKQLRVEQLAEEGAHRSAKHIRSNETSI